MSNQKKYTWNELYEKAVNCGCGSPELLTKDEARNQLGELILCECGYNIEQSDCAEDEIDIFLLNRETPVLFDERGNIIEM